MAAGPGSPGYCKLCDSPFAPALNKMLAAGKNNGEIRRFFKDNDIDLAWDRSTLYKHRDEHITHPLVTAAKQSQQNPIIVPKSTRAALEAVRDIGVRRAVEHPEEVNVDHALKAMSILQREERGPDNVMVVIAKLIAGSDDEREEIIGEYVDVTPRLEDSPVEQ